MSLNIKNPTVVALARELADALGTTQVGGLEAALRDKLAAVRAEQRGGAGPDRSRQVLERLWADGAELPSRAELDRSLYDHAGLPR